jgi:hypothetical membrane protein
MTIQQLLLSCGAIAGPFFIAVFLIEGALRSKYDPLRQAVSALAIGPRGWVQQTNFIVTGALMFAYAFGLSSALRAYGGSFWAPVLVGIYALGLIGAGIALLPCLLNSLEHRIGSVHGRSVSKSYFCWPA